MKKNLIILCCLLSAVLFITACDQKCTGDLTESPKPTAFCIVDCETPHEYDELIQNYNNLISVRLSEEFENAFNNNDNFLDHISLQYMQKGTQLYENWNNMIVEMKSNDDNKEVFNYYFVDLNKDGILEAILQKNNKTILAIFTLVNEKVCLLDAFWSRYKCNIIDENIYIISSCGVTTDFFVKNVESNSSELKKIQEYSVEETENGTAYFKISNDVKNEITEDEFNLITTNFEKE